MRGEAMTTEHRDTFDKVAAEYHAVRPAYPEALFAELAEVAGGAGARVLEVGCGSGQATRGFLDRGWEVVAVDPGAELVGLAKASLAGRPVAFHVGRFEAFAPEPAGFRLVASAQAWHWVDPAVGFGKVVEALAPGGWFAVFGHVPMPPGPEILARVEPIYREIAPELWGGTTPEAWYLPEGPVSAMIEATGLFGPVIHRAYGWSEQTNAAGLARQLGTRSYYNLLPADRRDRLLAEVEKALTPLGEFAMDHETHLHRAALRF